MRGSIRKHLLSRIVSQFFIITFVKNKSFNHKERRTQRFRPQIAVAAPLAKFPQILFSLQKGRKDLNKFLVWTPSHALTVFRQVTYGQKIGPIQQLYLKPFETLR